MGGQLPPGRGGGLLQWGSGCCRLGGDGGPLTGSSNTPGSSCCSGWCCYRWGGRLLRAEGSAVTGAGGRLLPAGGTLQPAAGTAATSGVAEEAGGGLTAAG